ncbi:MAG TPA: DUF2939 domain-containing protein [Polyangiaceae bacterium]|nr:DUF2939 domain-containing protein [Polyangiaceae bacterium]
MKKLLAAVIVLALAVWVFASPYVAVRGMKSAADAKDAAALSAYVDFAAVRESLKTGVQGKVAAVAGVAPENPFAAFGASLAQAFANPMIDTLVTPESLSMMLAGNVPARAQGLMAAAAPGADVETSMGYTGVNTFELDVKGKGAPGNPIGFVLTRSGVLSWKLTAVKLP